MVSQFIVSSPPQASNVPDKTPFILPDTWHCPVMPLSKFKVLAFRISALSQLMVIVVAGRLTNSGSLGGKTVIVCSWESVPPHAVITSQRTSTSPVHPTLEKS